MRLLWVRILFETKSDHFSDILEEFVHGPPLGVASAQSGHLAHEESVFVFFDHNIELPMGHGRNLLFALPRIKTQGQSPYYLIGNNRGMGYSAVFVADGCSAILVAKQLGSCFLRVIPQLLVHSRVADFVLPT
jgi:hypothetical protein